MKIRKSKIVLVGAGNVATQLGLALRKKGFPIIQVYSHTEKSAKELANKLDTQYTNSLPNLSADGDIYIFSVKDSVLSDLLKTLSPLPGLMVHTAGSIPITIFESGSFNRYGVIYPLQTFSKEREISFDSIPLFIEANNPENEKILHELAITLSDKVIYMSSEKRKYLHLAAVFACNFVNHMYSNAVEILEKEDLSTDFLLPLIEETASKITTLHPRDTQTGPAMRYDTNVIHKHLDLLKDDPEKERLYQFVSESIFKFQNR